MAEIVLFPAMKPKREFSKPPLIEIPHPSGEGTISVAVSPLAIEELMKAGRRVPVFQMWAHVVGEMPPVNNAYHYPHHRYPGAIVNSMQHAHACFKGVQRPLNKEDDGADVYVYVISTPQTVTWKSDMACVVALVDSPPNTVFTVHVRPADALQIDEGEIWGAATKWEFVSADAERPTLPEAYSTRYSETVWERV